MAIGPWMTITALVALIGSLSLLLVMAGDASAAEQALWQRCDGGAEDVSCSFERGGDVAASPVSGDLYVSDGAISHNRIVEYTAWGQFVRTWGWGVLNGSPESQVCEVPTDCQNGISGGGAGQFSLPQGIVVDSVGDVYISELLNHRVQKFDSEGHFLLMFGGNVNRTKVEALAPEAQRNLCPIDPGDVCQAGTEGTGKGQFGLQAIGSFIAAGPGPARQVYVGDKGRIQVFKSNGEYEKDIPVSSSVLPGGDQVQSLVAGPQNSLFFTLAVGSQTSSEAILPNVTKINASTGIVAGENCRVARPTALAVAATPVTAEKPNGAPVGELYVLDEGSSLQPAQVRRFGANDPACGENAPVTEPGEVKVSLNPGSATVGLGAGKVCLSKGVDVYLSNKNPDFIRAYGPAPDKLELCERPSFPPEIISQFAVSVGTVEAALRAKINPRFGADATYYVQYGPSGCFGVKEGEEVEESVWKTSLESGCAKEQPAPPGVLLGAGAIDFPFTSAKLFLAGLAPATAYRYRFVAQSSGGGPVFGVGGKPGEAGADAEFTTAGAPTEEQTACPNQVFRTGASARLPDCRAFELVTPLDKQGGDILSLPDASGRPAELDQSSASGERFTYSTFRSFGGAQSATGASQYVASRDPATGWSNEAISPPQGIEFSATDNLGTANRGDYEAFSPDLCSGWLIHNASTGPVLASGVEAEKDYLYKRSICTGGSDQYRALSKVGPGSATVQTVSADGSTAVFRTNFHVAGSEVPTAVGTTLGCFTSIDPRLTKSTTYQWLRNGDPIPGATEVTSTLSSNQYKTTAEDVGKTVQCRVTVATANSGSTQVANPAWVIAPYPSTPPPLAPGQIAVPVSDGPLVVGDSGGQTLSCDPGVWQGSPTFSYQWYRDGIALSGNGAETPEYTVQAADLEVPASFQCEVTGANLGGGVARVSANLSTSPAPSLGAPEGRPETAVGQTKEVTYVASGDGGLRAVCVLPGGIASDSCSAGTRGTAGDASPKDARSDTVQHALSDDGSRLFWTNSTSSPGRIYLRENPTQPPSALALGEATGAGKRTSGSTEVSEVSTANGAFAVGQTVSGEGVPFGTTILAVGVGTLTLSANATTNTGSTAVLRATSACTEVEKACTVGVSEAVETTPASQNQSHFWDATPSGSMALFATDPDGSGAQLSDLYSFDLATQTPTLIAHEVFGVLGASNDLSRVYFASREAIAGSGANSEDDSAQEGEPNVYLYRAAGGGTYSFVATLAIDDTGTLRNIDEQSPVHPEPYNHSARVSPDGESLAFVASSSPTGYANTDVATGIPDSEVFHYDAASGQLACVSCSPSGARPAGRPISGFSGFGVSARVPHSPSQLHLSNVLSEDGSRLFFESYDALRLADTNGARDVYEWEAAGSGTCTAAAPAFSPANGGCLSLVSSGESPLDSDLIDASPDGHDVFIRTGASLLPQDPGSFDIYDARVDGGFPPPPAPQPPCEGEACQSPPPPPAAATPASSAFQGQGNLSQAPQPRCAKGKRKVVRKGKARCVRKHKRHTQTRGHRRANSDRGGAR